MCPRHARSIHLQPSSSASAGLLFVAAIVLALLLALQPPLSRAAEAQDNGAGGTGSTAPAAAPDEADKDLLDTAEQAFGEWVDGEGQPYRDVAVELGENDGYFATVTITAQFRAGREAPWTIRRLAVECRRVGEAWRCDQPADIPFAFWLSGGGPDKTQQLVGVWPDGAGSVLAEIAEGQSLVPSADGKHIAYPLVVLDPKYLIDVAVVGRDGADERRLKDLVGHLWNNIDWSWSPTGSQLALTAWTLLSSTPGPDAEYQSTFYLWDLEADVLSGPLEPSAGWFSSPIWSSDGRSVLIAQGSTDESKDIELQFRDAGTLDIRQTIVITRDVYPSAWSTDEDLVLLQNRNAVVLLDTQTEELRDLCPVGAKCGRPALSADGKQVAFLQLNPSAEDNTADDRVNLTIVDVATADARSVFPIDLTPAALINPDAIYGNFPLKWSVDAQYISLHDVFWTGDSIVRVADGRMWSLSDAVVKGPQLVRWGSSTSTLALGDDLLTPCPPSTELPDDAMLYVAAHGGIFLNSEGVCHTLPQNVVGRAQKLSPSGERLASDKYEIETGTFSLMVTDLQRGLSQTAATSVPGIAYDLWEGPVLMDWSGDSRLLAYSWPDGEEKWAIYVYDAESGENRRVSPDDGAYRYPRWSHDGTMLSFCKGSEAPMDALYVDLGDPNASGSQEPGAAQELLAQLSQSTCMLMDWSPISAEVAVAVPYGEGRRTSMISIIGTALGSARPLVEDSSYLYAPAYSPDGKRIAYLRAGQKWAEPTLVLADVELGKLLLELSLPGEDQAWQQPQWSPNGQFIALVTDRGEGPFVLRLKDLTLWRATDVDLRTWGTSWFPNAHAPLVLGQWMSETVSYTGSASAALGLEPPAALEAVPESKAEPRSGSASPGPVYTADANGTLEIPVLGFSNSTVGSGSLDGYSWQVPRAFGTCPSTPDALVAGTADPDARTPVSPASPADWMSAPGLDYTVDLPAGEYVVAVCGCAPQQAAGEAEDSAAHSGDAAGSAENNASVSVGFNGGPTVLDGYGQLLPISGFAAAQVYTWQDRWLDSATGTRGVVTISAPESGVQTIHLWMADGGLIVHSLRLTPLALVNVELGAAPAPCGPSLGAEPAK